MGVASVCYLSHKRDPIPISHFDVGIDNSIWFCQEQNTTRLGIRPQKLHTLGVAIWETPQNAFDTEDPSIGPSCIRILERQTESQELSAASRTLGLFFQWIEN